MAVIGYTFNAENLCPGCTIKAMSAAGIKVQRGKAYEEAIRKAAGKLGIDFSDERTWDSGDFPKVVTDQTVQTELHEIPEIGDAVISDERCDSCGKWLGLGEKSPSESKLAAHLAEKYELPKSVAANVGATLREWGWSHPEFIDGDIVKLGVRQVPHDYETCRLVLVSGSDAELRLYPTPQEDGEGCFHCDALWEDHRFNCDVCKKEVEALDLHRHQTIALGQLPAVK
ncbi:hypothetical protein [Saccharothrix sp. ST-888]|uniref:hypothetical protein n=1 Tax=Saccharothrix sp. ST-888 TaxID=1427391 RepID=UPI000696DDDC|nr:hypothetical protein [Saccharothrix sp. ST-888]